MPFDKDKERWGGFRLLLPGVSGIHYILGMTFPSIQDQGGSLVCFLSIRAARILMLAEQEAAPIGILLGRPLSCLLATNPLNSMCLRGSALRPFPRSFRLTPSCKAATSGWLSSRLTFYGKKFLIPRHSVRALFRRLSNPVLHLIT
jgi:hypothetical protein